MSEHPHSLNEALGHTASDKRLDVLRQVALTGSISQAARDVGISYKAAWQAIDTLTNLSGWPLVDRSVGGSGGGGARLTPQGVQLLALADELAQARAQVLARFAGRQSSAAGLGWRTSMRNQLPCEVVGLSPVGLGSALKVSLVTAGGDELASLLTRESADLLGLVPGLSVLALCKATAVAMSADLSEAVSAWAPTTGSGSCVLRGTVAAAADPSDDPAGPTTGNGKAEAPGANTQEVGLTLVGGQRWVGFTAQGHRLVAGQAACAVFAPSSVVIGLDG